MSASLSTPPDRFPSLKEPISARHTSGMQSHIWLLLVALGPILLLALKLVPMLDRSMYHDPLSHLLISGDASLLSAALAVLMLRVAYRAQDGRIFLVGMGFLSTSSMLIVHYRLSTPSMLLAGCGFISQWPPLLSLGVGGIFFALSGLDLSPQVNRRLMRLAGVGLIAFLILWLVYSWVFLIRAPALLLSASGLTNTGEAFIYSGRDNCVAGSHFVANVWPDASGQKPELVRLDALLLALGIGGLSCYGFAVQRHYRLYRRSPSPAGLALTSGVTMFGEALLSVLVSHAYALSFWLYHIELAAGYSVIGFAMLRAYHHGQTDDSLLDRLFLSGTRARLQASYAQALDELITMLAHAELPTTRLQRTLQYRFGLGESQLEVLAQAAAAVAQERQQRQELQQLNLALHQLEQDKSLFTQMLVHDLKNPLSGQLACLELLQREPLSERQRLLSESALWSSKELLALIANLLDLTRLEEGQLELQRSLVPPRELLDACANELRGWIDEEHKTIRIEVAPDLPLLHIDLYLIRRVLLNLLSNAIKHTSAGTDISLCAFTASKQSYERTSLPRTDGKAESEPNPVSRISIEVTDTGPGIPAEYLDHIFEKYVRVDGAQQERHHSSGLGLTFCRLAVEAHGGTISITSEVGVGTTFQLNLPAV